MKKQHFSGRDRKKRCLSALLALGMLLLQLPAAALAAGAADDGYTLIETEAELKEISGSGNYRLANDITLTDAWTPVSRFSGTLDGDGHTISGLNVNSSETCVGLIGYLQSGGTVMNLTVSGSVTGTCRFSGRTGGIAGQSYGTITHCTFSGSVTHAVGNNNAVGGIAGINNGTITYCTNDASVAGQGTNEVYVGGITGSNHGRVAVSNCANNGAVSGTLNSGNTYYGEIFGSNRWETSGGYVGGIAGDTQDNNLDTTTCTNSGMISVTSNGKTETVGGGGDPEPAAHSHDGITFTETATLPTAAGSYCLTADVELGDSATWTVPEGQVHLCLNGHIISHNVSPGILSSAIMLTDPSGGMTLYNCKDSGKVSGGRGIYAQAGNLALKSGVAVEGTCYGVEVGDTRGSSAALTIESGVSISAEMTGSDDAVSVCGLFLQPTGTVAMTGGTVSAQGGHAAYGVGGGSQTTISGGTITADNGTGHGYALEAFGSVTIQNAPTLTGSTATAFLSSYYEDLRGSLNADGYTGGAVTMEFQSDAGQAGDVVATNVTDAAKDKFSLVDHSRFTLEYDSDNGVLKLKSEDIPIPTTYTVTFDANGATSGSTFTREATGSGQVRSVDLTKPDDLDKNGYTFMGWSDKDNYAALVRPGSNTPHWNSYDYDCGDGEGTVKFYSVVGDGDPSAAAHVTGDTTFYAVWAKNTLDVDGDGAGDYPLLRLAFEYAADNAAIKVLESYTDLTYGELITDRTLTLDLNGQTVASASVMIAAGSLTVTGGGTLNGAALLGAGELIIDGAVLSSYIHQQMGTLTVKSGAVGGLLKYGGKYGDEYVYNGTTSLQGGTFEPLNTGDSSVDGKGIVYYGMSAESSDDAVAGLKAMLAAGYRFSQEDDRIKTAEIMDEGWIAYFEGSVSVIPDSTEPAAYTVTFDANGRGTAPAAIAGVVSGDKITAPAAPTADGYTFGGWYKEASCANAWDFAVDTVTDNITLYAKWTQDIPDPVPATYTVTFDANGRGTAPAAIAGVVSGDKITAPAVPTADGYTFGGWYKEASCANAWDFAVDTVTDNITLYAKWTPAAVPAPPPAPGGGSATYPITQSGTTYDGSVIISHKNAGRGTTVTITIKPDQGCELYHLTVTDAKGNALKLADRGNGKYTFTMPNGKVTVAASFRRLPGWEHCSQGSDCPIWPFTDASATEWYHDGVHFCLENGLMGGCGNGEFGPNAPLSRAMLTQILYNSEERPAVSGSSVFTDVADGAWYTDAIIWASANGIVTGYPGDIYGPEDPINREQLAVMLYRYAQYKGMAAVTLAENLTQFTDADKISGYAVQAMNWAVNTGVIGGYEDQTLRPQENATRAVVAQMLKNFFANVK